MGLFRKLGSFAEKVWSIVRGREQPIQEAARMADLGGVSVEPADLARDLRHLERRDYQATTIAEVMESEYIPISLYEEALVPWRRTFAYEITISGMNLVTMEEETTERWLTFSEEWPVGDILELAEEYFGEGGEYEQLRISSMSVTGAEYVWGASFGG